MREYLASEREMDLRRAENVGVHAVLLGEDEGDNALWQRCLQRRIAKKKRKKKSVASSRARANWKGERAFVLSKSESARCTTLPAQAPLFFFSHLFERWFLSVAGLPAPELCGLVRLVRGFRDWFGV